MKAKEFCLLIVLSLLWGSCFLIIKLAINLLPPCTLVAGRLFFASFAIVVYVYISGDKLPRLGRSWIPFLILGLTNCTVPFLLVAWGQIYIDSGLAAILGSTMPLFTVLFGLAITKSEILNRGKALGIVIGLVGVILLVGVDAMSGLKDNVLAQLANIMAAVIFAYAAVYGSLLKNMKPVVLCAGQMLMGLFTIIPFALFEVPWTLELSLMSVVVMAILGIVFTVIPYVIYFYLLASIGATKTSMVTYLIPVVGVVIGMIFLNEHVSVTSILALVLILAGVVVVNGIRFNIMVKPKTNLSG